MLSMDARYKCCPNYFYQMTKRIISPSENAVVAMMDKLEGMKFSDL